ncbi:hypothetical protein KSF_027350 [Reticulibacter mediterranei]|uniref:Uncharacterized protein n=1 Tax=Reticulibacter mediterranei TaxID=2778369 RepID=A0A8J3N317_9CHLR|nr:hypothetical protein [Reticulibacter mediterranei]GHO92687.1 hypothetical protein KSF_027350 [Reticulibacter mediterranei]
MYCLFCDTNLSEEALFCLKCGRLTPRGSGEAGESEHTTVAAVSSPFDPYHSRPSTSYGSQPAEGGTQNPYAPLAPPPTNPRQRRISPGLLKGLVSGIAVVLLLSSAAGALLILKPGAHLRSTGHSTVPTVTPRSTAVAYQGEDGHLWHTIRHADGPWSGLGDVNSQVTIPGPVRAIAATSSQSGEAQFMFATADGHLWHSIRHADGSWQVLDDVSAQLAISGPVRVIAATNSQPGETQYMFATADGHLWHTIRQANGSWSGLDDITAQLAVPGPVRAIAATSSQSGEAQFMFATADGHLWHSIRHVDGSWSGLGDVNSQVTIPGPVRAITATSSQSGEAQFMFATADGHLWHTIRHADGSWSGLDDITAQLAIPASVSAVAAASSQSGGEFMFTTADGHLWHTLQRSDGSWSGLGDVNSQVTIPGPVRAVAATSSQSGEAQFMFAT